MLGINLNQEDYEGEGEEHTWDPVGTTGIHIDVTNHASAALYLRVVGAAGHPDESWCINLTASGRMQGIVLWNELNSECWSNDGSWYDGRTLLQSVRVSVFGDDDFEYPFSYCINDIGPV